MPVRDSGQSARRPPDRSLWWPMSVALYAQALLVCHEVLGAPDDARVREINNAM